MRAASSRRPASAASTRARHCSGSALPATLISPSAPTAIAGSARASSPERTYLPSGSVRQISPICARLPEDSFTATTLGISQSRDSRAGVMFSPVRPGTLYAMTGLPAAASAALRKCATSPFGFGLL